jgi:hypothetical protein
LAVLGRRGNKAEADEAEQEKAGERIRLTVPKQAYRYLGWLARHTLVGRTEEEVARQFLIAKLSEMRREEYKDPEKT